jgi:hypothetical protein
MNNFSSPQQVTLADPRPVKSWGALATSTLTVFLTALLGVGAWLFAPSDLSEVQPPENLESYQYVDGVMAEVELPKLVMNAYEEVNGQTVLTFTVPESSLRYFDVVHLRAHSSIGLPTRIYYEEIDGELIAIYKIDAPANSGGE